MATTYYNDLQKLYVAYFNRPGDTTGLANYETQLEAAGTDAKAIAAVMARISAEFSNSQEYKANFTGKTNAEIVDTVYMNLFGRPADAGGKAFYADNLTAGKLTVAAVVTEVAKGAQGSDMVAYNNKVTAAAAFSAALKTTDSYNTQLAATAAKAFLSGVTDNASLANAIDPVLLQVAIAKVNAAAQPFSLETGLATLAAANAAKTAFVDVAADGKADGKFGTFGTDAAAQASAEAKIGTDVGVKTGAVAALVNVAGADYAQAPASVQAALLAQQQATNQAALTKAQGDLATANTNIGKVAGLTTALATQTSAKTADTAAVTADNNAKADLAAKLAAYNSLNSTNLTVNADGTVTGLIKLSNGALVLNSSSVTETANPGVTALLAASTAKLASAAAVVSTHAALAAANEAVNYLDMNATEKADLTAIGAAMKNVTLDANALPTTAQITTEQTILQAKLDAATKADADYATAHGGTHDATLAAAVTTATTNQSTFNGLVTTYRADYVQNDLVGKQTTAQTAIDTANTTIKNLADAVTALNKAVMLNTELTAMTNQVTAATTAFTDNKLSAPMQVSGFMIANVGSDIYDASSLKSDAQISLFALQGNDALFIGNKFTLNTTGDITKGNDAAMEAFVIKSGNDTKIVLEQKAFASNETTPGADLVTITLTGVDSTKVHLNNGIITVS